MLGSFFLFLLSILPTLFFAQVKGTEQADPFLLQAGSRFEHLNIQDGLSHSTVFSMMQDKTGLMWFGTQDGGLNKYDGYKFTVYSHDPDDSSSISTNNISKIVQDKDGNIWIGTWGGGLEKFDPVAEKFTHFRHHEKNLNGLSHDNAQTIFTDRNGNIWVGTAGGGLNRLDPKTRKFTLYKNDKNDPSSISHDRIWDIEEDKKGFIWVGTSNGLNKLDPGTGKFVRFMHQPGKKENQEVTAGISHPKVRTVYVDHADNVWIGTTIGIDLYVPASNSFEHFSPYPLEEENQETNEVNVIFEDHLGRMWTGTHAGGLSVFDRQTKSFIHFLNRPNDAYSLSYNDVRDICEDRSGVLWVSTRGGGINKLDLKPQKFVHLKAITDEPNSLQGDRVKSICTAPGKLVWIGTDGGGLSCLDRKTNTFRHYKHDPKDPGTISTNKVRSVFRDNTGWVWVGTYGGGLNLMDEKTGKVTRFSSDPKNPASLGDDDVFSFAHAGEKNMWIGTDNGLDRFDIENKTFTHYRNDPDDKNSISNNRIWYLFNDSKETLWIGTDEGLNSFDATTKKFTQYKNDNDNKNSISNNDVFCINEDAKGGLWIGTGRGLNYFDRASGKFTAYTDKQGLPGNAVYSIQFDRLGNLWISTINGLSQFDPVSRRIVQNYFIYDGLQSNEFNQSSGSAGEDGFLYFGGNNGFNLFDPHHVKKNTYVPEIVFTEFTLFNKPVGIGNGSPLQGAIAYTHSITLSYDQSVFGFVFSALNYNVPGKNQYAYLMEGFNKEWTFTGNKREANYTNLSPGTYTFRVKAANNDGLWNERGISISLTIIPPFWQTKWFYALCAVFAIGLVFLFIRWREKSLQREKKILEEKVAIRTDKIEKQKQELEEQKEELAARNRDVTDSIRYAKRIQEAILPPMHIVQKNLNDHFILYRPKDIVSGDFYWVEEANAIMDGTVAEVYQGRQYVPREVNIQSRPDNALLNSGVSLVAVVDCTGHGVPGALVSIIGCNGLHRTVNEFGLSQPSLILEKLHELVIETLHQGETDMKDGMDITLCAINWNNREISFAGANNPIYIVSNKQNKFEEEFKIERSGEWCLYEIKGDKQPVGGVGMNKKAFTNRKFILEKGETLYLFSDGYADQFGGERGKKFKYSQLKELLLSLQGCEMEEQKHKLNERFDEWRGNLEQVDDVCVIGIRMG